MKRCEAIKADGTRCERMISDDATHCYSHNPKEAERRSKNARHAGRARGLPAEIAAIKDRIRELSEDVISGKVDKGRASVAFTGYGVLTRVIELERKHKEEQELEQIQERLAAIEARAKRVRGV